jgi:hypothetical protein
MKRETQPSFSRSRRWTVSVNVAVSTIAVLALVAMLNYLAARHFTRVTMAARSQVELSPLTKRTLDSLTNNVRVIIYFDKDEGLYDSVWSLLKEYKFANPRIVVETIDYLRDPAAAQVIKAKYGLPEQAEKNVVIFASGDQKRLIYEGELSELDIKPLVTGQSREIRRTHFKGELLFTSALQSLSTFRPLKAYFVQGHGEHRPDSDDKLMGYSKFAGVLDGNNVKYETLTLFGSSDIPSDCNLLIIPGATDPFLNEEIEKIDRYLKQGGRMFLLFNYATVKRPTGLEKLLTRWGVEAGSNIVIDRENSMRQDNDMIVSHFGDHPLIKPLTDSRLYIILPRSIARAQNAASAADAPKVEVLAGTGPNGRVITDIREKLVPYERPDDFVGSVPIIAAVEKGAIRGVSADRGSTRIVVAGDSYFLRNGTIESVANLEFASYAINWLLARNEYLVALPPRPIKEYKISMTQSQRAAVGWILIGGMPASVLLLGLLVWIRRRT